MCASRRAGVSAVQCLGFEAFARAVGATGLGLAVGAPGEAGALNGDREGKFLAALLNGVMFSKCSATFRAGATLADNHIPDLVLSIL